MTDALTKNVTATSILQTIQEWPACSAAPSVRLRLSARAIPSFPMFSVMMKTGTTASATTDSVRNSNRSDEVSRLPSHHG